MKSYIFLLLAGLLMLISHSSRAATTNTVVELSRLCAGTDLAEKDLIADLKNQVHGLEARLEVSQQLRRESDGEYGRKIASLNEMNTRLQNEHIWLQEMLATARARAQESEAVIAGQEYDAGLTPWQKSVFTSPDLMRDEEEISIDDQLHTAATQTSASLGAEVTAIDTSPLFESRHNTEWAIFALPLCIFFSLLLAYRERKYRVLQNLHIQKSHQTNHSEENEYVEDLLYLARFEMTWLRGELRFACIQRDELDEEVDAFVEDREVFYQQIACGTEESTNIRRDNHRLHMQVSRCLRTIRSLQRTVRTTEHLLTESEADKEFFEQMYTMLLRENTALLTQRQGMQRQVHHLRRRLLSLNEYTSMEEAEVVTLQQEIRALQERVKRNETQMLLAPQSSYLHMREAM